MADSVAVVGGGLAGLAAASRLAEADFDVTLFERREGAGGRVRSTREDGFVFDRGFQVLFTAYPAARRELDLDALDLRYFTPGACLCRTGRRSILSDPLRDPGSLTDSLFNTEVSVGDKLRTLALRRRLGPPDPDAFSVPDRSIRAALLDRGFSERFVENFAAPFYGGITLDRSLSTSAAVFDYTFAALAGGRIAIPADGMGAIADQLAERARDAGAAIRTDAEVDTVDGDTPEVRLGGETVAVDAVVVAADPPTARELTGIDSIPTDARGCVTGWYALPGEPLDAGRRILLNAADDAPNHVIPHSAVAPEYAPDGEVLLSATFLGQPDASDHDLAATTREALASWYPERSFDELRTLRTDRIPFAQLVQPPGFFDDLPGVRDPEGPVYLAGEYTAWSSIQGALESGREAARAVRADLRSQ